MSEPESQAVLQTEADTPNRTEQPTMNLLRLPLVEARRCDGRVSTMLNKHATAADPWFFTADDGTTYVVKVASPKDRTAVPHDWQPPSGERLDVVDFLVARRSGLEQLFKVPK